MSVLLWIILAIGIVSLLTWLISRAPLQITFVLFLALPIGLSVYWEVAGIEAHLFQYVKVYSVCACALLIAALRYKSWIEIPWMRILGYLLLALNILEAIISDASGGGFLNMIAGGLLILSQAFPNKIYINPEDDRRFLRYDLGLDWIIAYAIWNITFVYGFAGTSGNPGESTAFAICHLAVPLFLMGKTGELFMQARAYSLTIFMMVRISLPFEPYIYLVPEWYNPTLLLILRWVSLAVAMFIVGRRLMQWNQEQTPHNLIDLFRKWFKINDKIHLY